MNAALKTAKPSYVVKFVSPTDPSDWSRIDFSSITKALGFISLMLKRGCICQVFQK